MALSIRGRPVRFSLAWLKPPPAPADGNMTLVEHLRELRYRLVFIVVAILLGTAVVGIFNAQLFDLLMLPYERAQATLLEKNPDMEVTPIVEGVTAGFVLVIKTCLVGGLVLTSPIWLYQIWAFIVPGLLAREKKWSLIFLSAAVPLFLLGVVLAYFVIPAGIGVLIGFTPGGGTISNLLDVNNFLTFLIRVMVVFGLGFELPVFVLALNFTGVVSAAALAKARRVVIFCCFVFAMLATPSDPISMLMLGIPMSLLYVAAEVIVNVRERSLARREKEAPAGSTGVDRDRALAELDGRDLDAEEPGAKQTMAELLGLESDGDDNSTSRSGSGR